MKPEIKSMLPDWPHNMLVNEFSSEEADIRVITLNDFKFWLEKLTEGASVIYADEKQQLWDASPNGASHTALLICPREIKKQTPLEIAVEAIKKALVEDRLYYKEEILEEALAKIEAAK